MKHRLTFLCLALLLVLLAGCSGGQLNTKKLQPGKPAYQYALVDTVLGLEITLDMNQQQLRSLYGSDWKEGVNLDGARYDRFGDGLEEVVIGSNPEDMVGDTVLIQYHPNGAISYLSWRGDTSARFHWGGIPLGTSKEELIRLFGPPDHEAQSGEYTYLNYRADDGSGYCDLTLDQNGLYWVTISYPDSSPLPDTEQPARPESFLDAPLLDTVLDMEIHRYTSGQELRRAYLDWELEQQYLGEADDFFEVFGGTAQGEENIAVGYNEDGTIASVYLRGGPDGRYSFNGVSLGSTRQQLLDLFGPPTETGQIGEGDFLLYSHDSAMFSAVFRDDVLWECTFLYY